MISLEDCIAMCGLESDEVAAICEHEHIGEIPAAALASYLLHQAHGAQRIRAMIIDDIHDALDRNEVKHAAELAAVLRHFLQHHPEAAADMEVQERRGAAWSNGRSGHEKFTRAGFDHLALTPLTRVTPSA